MHISTKQMFPLLLQAFVSNAYKRQGGVFLCFSQEDVALLVYHI